MGNKNSFDSSKTVKVQRKKGKREIDNSENSYISFFKRVNHYTGYSFTEVYCFKDDENNSYIGLGMSTQILILSYPIVRLVRKVNVFMNLRQCRDLLYFPHVDVLFFVSSAQLFRVRGLLKKSHEETKKEMRDREYHPEKAVTYVRPGCLLQKIDETRFILFDRICCFHVIEVIKNDPDSILRSQSKYKIMDDAMAKNVSDDILVNHTFYSKSNRILAIPINGERPPYFKDSNVGTLQILSSEEEDLSDVDAVVNADKTKFLHRNAIRSIVITDRDEIVTLTHSEPKKDIWFWKIDDGDKCIKRIIFEQFVLFDNLYEFGNFILVQNNQDSLLYILSNDSNQIIEYSRTNDDEEETLSNDNNCARMKVKFVQVCKLLPQKKIHDKRDIVNLGDSCPARLGRLCWLDPEEKKVLIGGIRYDILLFYKNLLPSSNHLKKESLERGKEDQSERIIFLLHNFFLSPGENMEKKDLVEEEEGRGVTESIQRIQIQMQNCTTSLFFPKILF